MTRGGKDMLRRISLLAVVAVVFAAMTPSAAADPVKAKNALIVTATCDGTQGTFAVNGQGAFTPGHAIGSTAVFVPTALNLTFSFTPTGGAAEIETLTAAKAREPTNAVTCEVPAALNTFVLPFGTFVVSGTATGFFTPAS
jgi:hypothetical protein